MADGTGSSSGGTSNGDTQMVCRKSLEPNFQQLCFSVKPTGYELYLEMGHACSGTAPIYLGKHTPSGHFVAIRQAPLEHCSVNIEELQHEIVMHKTLDCENILTYLSTFICGKTLWIIMPLLGYGSCTDIIHAHFQCGLPEAAIALILMQTIQAIIYLHQRGTIHRSIQASHVLVSHDGHVQLTGLRNCYRLENRGLKKETCHYFPASSVKSLRYLAPEVLAQNLSGYDLKSDIYSIGILACELANGAVPFADMTPPEILYEKMNGNTPFLLDCTTFDVNNLSNNENACGSAAKISSKQFSPQFHELAELCCQSSPEFRPTAESLLEHPFFKKSKKMNVSKLPSLLSPLNPLTHKDLTKKEDLGAIASLTHDMSMVSMTQEGWDFDV